MANATQLSTAGSRGFWFALARVLSDLFSPPVIGIPFLALAAAVSNAPWAYWYALLYFLVAVPVPMVYVMWLTRTGRVTDFHLPARHERFGPFIISLCAALCAIGVLYFLAAPTEFVATVFTIFVQTILLFVVTLFWKVSIHTATISGLVTFAVITVGSLAWLLIPLVPLVAWARIYLGRHTLLQTAAGAVLGYLTFATMFALHGTGW